MPQALDTSATTPSSFYKNSKRNNLLCRSANSCSPKRAAKRNHHADLPEWAILPVWACVRFLMCGVRPRTRTECRILLRNSYGWEFQIWRPFSRVPSAAYSWTLALSARTADATRCWLSATTSFKTNDVRTLLLAEVNEVTLENRVNQCSGFRFFFLLTEMRYRKWVRVNLYRRRSESRAVRGTSCRKMPNTSTKIGRNET